MRPYQVATAAILILIAAVAMFDTRAGALPDPEANVPGGLRGGWYPFWSAAVGAAATLVVLVRAMTLPQPATGIFQTREGLRDVLGLIAPMIGLLVLMNLGFGFYAAGALYLGFFARVIGHFRWLWSLASALGIPVVVYVVFERFFLVPLPKSLLYASGILPF